MKNLKAMLIKEVRIGDIIVVLLAVGGIIASLLWISHPREDQNLYIYKDNHLWGQYALGKDTVIDIDEHNRCEIVRGKVRMIYSDCPDKRCIKQGFSNSIPIICMPNRLILEIGTDQTHHKLILQ